MAKLPIWWQGTVLQTFLFLILTGYLTQATFVSIQPINIINNRRYGSSTSFCSLAALVVEDHFDVPPSAKGNCLLGEFLLTNDPLRFPSKSKAKRACAHGSVAFSRDPNAYQQYDKKFGQWDGLTIPFSNIEYQRNMTSLRPEGGKMKTRAGDDNDGLVIPYSVDFSISPGGTVLILSRTSDDYYPVAVTKNILPPLAVTKGNVSVIFEDEDLAVVQKPENMTTIGKKSLPIISGEHATEVDLQSCLGFLLRPSPKDQDYHPRPVHRLDRRTSGLVLVAKNQGTMRHLSGLFASRQVTKQYAALVLDKNCQSGFPTSSSTSSTTDVLETNVIEKGPNWFIIDHPIDGKEAVSEWRTLAATNKYRLVQVRPHHGRTHQIRRHLAYCVETPIVGDAKYDKGARDERTNGMYLCCCSLEFCYRRKAIYNSDVGIDNIIEQNVQKRPGTMVRRAYLDDRSIEVSLMSIEVPSIVYSTKRKTLRVSIPIPEKFYSRLDTGC